MNIQRAIKFLYPDVKYMFNGYEDYDYLMWPQGAGTKPTLQALQDADLDAAKADRILRAKTEASARIYASYPIYAQSNAALGLYDSYPDTDPFFPANMKAGIQTVITAYQAAVTAINALTDSESVDSFTW
jgi:hypothetical protein